MQKKQIYVSDTIHKTILTSSIEMNFVSSTLFNRLHNISQNSTAYLTFPTNRTKRFEHSLGTMKLCGDMFYYSICNAQESTLLEFFEQLHNEIKQIVEKTILSEDGSRYYRSILGDANLTKDILFGFSKLDSKINNIFYNSRMPNNVPGEYRIIFLILFQAVRLAALMHDVGHPPYSHITEHAMGNVYARVNAKKSKTSREIFFLEVMHSYIGEGKIALHEAMGNKMAQKLIEDYCSQFDANDLFYHKYFSVLSCILMMSILNEKTDFFKNIHRIIDGPLDGDRLDYVSRDIMNSGLNNGIIEYERIIYSMKLMQIDCNFLFIPDVKSLNTVEDFFDRRWGLYKNIIFHHRVVKTDALLSHSLEHIMLDYLENDTPEETENRKTLPDNISGLWKAIQFAASNNHYFNNLSQWDDNWLITVLKKSFFDDYYDKETNERYKLEEFLSNRKFYFSLIKSKTDFDYIEDSIKNYICEECQEEIKKDIPKPIADNFLRTQRFKSYLESINGYFKTLKSEFELYEFLQVRCKCFIDAYYQKQIKDIITLRKPIKTGLETELHIAKQNEPVRISKVSNIKEKLENETASPYFYIYVRYAENSFTYEETNELLTKMGTYLGESIKTEMHNIVNNIVCDGGDK